MSLRRLYKSNNQTRYATEDINEFFAAFGDAVDNVIGEETIQLVLPSVSSLAYLFDSQADRDELVDLGQTRLFIASPNRLAREEPLQALGALSRGVLPKDVMRSVASHLLSRAEFRCSLGYAYTQERREQLARWRGTFHASRPDIVEAAVEVDIHILPHVECGPRRALSKEAKLARFQSDGFYGKGGVLEGPRWAYASGDRSPTWRWHENLMKAQEYYDRERDHRMRWVKDIEALGGTAEPYETFADFLRKYADNLDKKHGGY